MTLNGGRWQNLLFQSSSLYLLPVRAEPVLQAFSNEPWAHISNPGRRRWGESPCQESSLTRRDQWDQQTALHHSCCWRLSEWGQWRWHNPPSAQLTSHLTPQFPKQAHLGTHRYWSTPGPSGSCHFSQHDEASSRDAANGVDGSLCYFLTVQIELDLEKAHCKVHLGGKTKVGPLQWGRELLNTFCPVSRLELVSKMWILWANAHSEQHSALPWWFPSPWAKPFWSPSSE